MKADLSNLESITNLSLKEDFLNLSKIISNIRQKKFNVLRHSSNIDFRIKKMTDRGWTKLENFNTIFITSKSTSMTEEITDKNVVDLVKKEFFSKVQKTITSIKVEVIFSNSFRKRFIGERDIISNENEGDPNIKILYHGTNKSGMSIIETGFKRSFSGQGNWGTGLYFASDMNKAIAYGMDSGDKKYRIFICKVILGKIQDLGKNTNSALNAAPRGFHSIHGFTNYDEYIVYQESQVLPIFFITLDMA